MKKTEKAKKFLLKNGLTDEKMNTNTPFIGNNTTQTKGSILLSELLIKFAEQNRMSTKEKQMLLLREAWDKARTGWLETVNQHKEYMKGDKWKYTAEEVKEFCIEFFKNTFCDYLRLAEIPIPTPYEFLLNKETLIHSNGWLNKFFDEWWEKQNWHTKQQEEFIKEKKNNNPKI